MKVDCSSMARRALALFSAAIALSKTLDYYADMESSQMNGSSAEISNNEEGADSDNENDTNNRNLYDKAGRVSRKRAGASGNAQEGDEEANIVSSNIKTIVVICSKSFRLHCLFHPNDSLSQLP
jgi:hypothetical protein